MKEKFPGWYSIIEREIAESLIDYGYCFPERYECLDNEWPGKNYQGWKIFTDGEIVEVYHQGACYWISCEFADLEPEDIKKEIALIIDETQEIINQIINREPEKYQQLSLL
ncbi:hypothetical protein H1P_5840004 [Hyella patelloides LEGE 07179]|uniref:Uncharacterized protein n=1 Tax=Hyella patelloides LEGE 07179 TaxID=945734 RepID=A0A563W0S7_9CYAN|nr:hypothetical protein [Hyella patelloides]VEP17298.1 hypothetical protein H1P_5840004 [Hyella patelloides LEGE 07179]